MNTPRYDAFELTDSAYRHGYHDEDVAEMLRGPHLVIRSRRGRRVGYEIFGRSRAGHYLLAVGRVIKYRSVRRLRVFHLNRMTDDERKQFKLQFSP